MSHEPNEIFAKTYTEAPEVLYCRKRFPVKSKMAAAAKYLENGQGEQRPRSPECRAPQFQISLFTISLFKCTNFCLIHGPFGNLRKWIYGYAGSIKISSGSQLKGIQGRVGKRK